MRVAIMGHRGIPARYGGFETLAEELSTRLVDRGHDVTVYVRKRYAEPGLTEHKGVELITLSSIAHKYFDTPSHTLLCALHALPGRYDAVLLLNAANAIFIPLLRVSGARIALNVDGIERRRKKWGPFGRFVYQFSEKLLLWMPAEIVTDARAIERYYLERHQAPSTVISYGSPTDPVLSQEELTRLQVKPGEYMLYVSRLEPENNAHAVIAAFERLATDKKLLIVGDAPYAADYIAQLKQTKDDRVVFPGAIYGMGYAELQSHAFAYIHATEVGGTHPALVEAMGYRNAVLSHRTDENEEVLADAGLYWNVAKPDSLTDALRRLLEDEPLRLSLMDKASARAKSTFSWTAITKQYESLFETMLIPGLI